MQRRIIDNLKVGELVFVRNGSKFKIGIIVGIIGSIYTEGLINHTYVILIEERLEKYKGWRIEPVGLDI